MKKAFQPRSLTLSQFEKSKPIARWIGTYLKKLRGSKPQAAIAKVIPCTMNELELLESGDFHFKAGRLHQLLSGYGITLADLLEKSAVECKQALKDEGITFSDNKPFSRNSFYSVRLLEGFRLQKSPLFVAGDPENFIWAVPFRKLESSDVIVEFLELAERRSRDKHRGKTLENAHAGSEIIHVIRGTVEFHIDDNHGDHTRKLQKNDLIHFDSSNKHYVENLDDNASAFLLIIRFACSQFDSRPRRGKLKSNN